MDGPTCSLELAKTRPNSNGGKYKLVNQLSYLTVKPAAIIMIFEDFLPRNTKYHSKSFV